MSQTTSQSAGQGRREPARPTGSGTSTLTQGGTGSPRPAARPPREPAPDRTPRRARLVLSRVDPWSVLKLSSLLAISLGIVLVVAVGVLWGVLDGMGVFDSVTKTVRDVTADNQGAGTDLTQWFGLERVLQLAALWALVNAILFTALATLTAFIYNVSAAVVGGLQVTLTEDS